jgi:hypothetical protein
MSNNDDDPSDRTSPINKKNVRSENGQAPPDPGSTEKPADAPKGDTAVELDDLLEDIHGEISHEPGEVTKPGPELQPDPEPDLPASDLDAKIVSVNQITDLSGHLPKGSSLSVDELQLQRSTSSYEGSGTAAIPPEIDELWKKNFSSAGLRISIPNPISLPVNRNLHRRRNGSASDHSSKPYGRSRRIMIRRNMVRWLI